MTTPTDQAMKILSLTDDLMFITRIEGTLRAAGYVVYTLPLARESVERAREWEPDGIVVSFGVPSRDWEDVIRAIRADGALYAVPLLAFGPHVDTVGSAAAKAAGATRVVTNGAFFNRMPAIVAALLGE